MQIIGYHTKDGKIFNSDGDVCDDKMKIVDFLLAQKPDTIKVFYHMNYNVANILKYLEIPLIPCKQLYDLGIMVCDGYEFRHIPGKFFSIKDIKAKDMGVYDTPFTNFGDVSQYTDTIDYLNISGANMAKDIGMEAYNAMKAMGLNPKKLTSPIKVWSEEVLDKMDLPVAKDYPDEVGQYAYQCCHGGWLEAFKKGHYDVLDYDQISAYAHQVTKLCDTRYGTWMPSKEYSSVAVYGFAKCIVNITSDFSPIICSNDGEQDESFTPTGEREQYLTKAEIDFIRNYKLGTVGIIDGWWWIPEKHADKQAYTVYRPLKKKLNELYALKEVSKGLTREVIKRVMNGVWGKFGEIYETKFGNNINPVWFAEAESQTRLDVAKFVLDNKLVDRLLSIAVDGVMIDNDPCKGSAAVASCSADASMGSWKLTAQCPAFIISSGVVAVKDKEAISEFSANYDWLYEQIENDPKASEYKQTKLSPVTLARAIMQNKFDQMGELIEITKTINVTKELKRMYKKTPKNGNDLLNKKYDSEPLDISMIRDLV